jgi:hypothetical protein
MTMTIDVTAGAERLEHARNWVELAIATGHSPRLSLWGAFIRVP